MINSVLQRYSLSLVGLTVLVLIVVCMPQIAEGQQVEWRSTLEEAQTQSNETGKPMMMDFYTDW